MSVQADLPPTLNGSSNPTGAAAAGLAGTGVVARTDGIEDAVASGAFERLASADVDAWLDGPGVRVLLFAGPAKRRRDAHDVAIALRELLRSYPGQASAAVFEAEEEAGQMQRFRVTSAPSLALCAGGAVLEVVPGVRDWADYAAVFRRYLGDVARG